MIKKTGQHLVLPFYHIVSDKNPIHIKNLYQPRNIKRFKADLDFLLDNYKSISIQELIALNKEDKPIDKNCFHLTFDDGLKEFYTEVAPILIKKNVHATVFLNTDFIDNKKLFYRFKASLLYEKIQDKSLLDITYNNRDKLDHLALEYGVDFNSYLSEYKPYMTSVQINELISQGITFGAHSKNHPLYNALTFEEQKSQTKESIDYVTKTFNLDYRVFSFPFTDDGVSKAFFDEASNFTDVTFGCAGLKEDSASQNFQRIGMELDETGKEIIKGEYLYYLLKKKAGKHKIIRQ